MCDIKKYIEALESEKWQDRQYALEMLEKTDSFCALKYVIKALGDREAAIRWRAARLIGKIGNKKAVPYLVNLLKDRNGEVRLNTVIALGDLRDVRALFPLIDMLEDDYRIVLDMGMLQGDARTASVKGAALYALQKIGDEGALPALKRMAETEINNTIRVILKDAIENLEFFIEENIGPLPEAADYKEDSGEEAISLEEDIVEDMQEEFEEPSLPHLPEEKEMRRIPAANIMIKPPVMSLEAEEKDDKELPSEDIALNPQRISLPPKSDKKKVSDKERIPLKPKFRKEDKVREEKVEKSLPIKETEPPVLEMEEIDDESLEEVSSGEVSLTEDVAEVMEVIDEDMDKAEPEEVADFSDDVEPDAVTEPEQADEAEEDSPVTRGKRGFNTGRLSGDVIEELLAEEAEEEFAKYITLTEEEKILQGEVLDKETETLIKEQIAVFEDDDSMFARLDAVQTLEKIGKPALAPLLRALEDQNWRIREGVAETLLAMSNISSLPFLEKALPIEPEESIKKYLEKAICQIEMEKEIKGCIERLEDGNIFTQLDAVKTLEVIGEPAIEHLLEALESENWKIREGVVEVLAIIGDYSIVEELEKALKREKDKYVKKIIKKAIKKLEKSI